jgi:acetylornithine deacetylase/succinyl-diaminopimelate desuccinylase-like protein
VPGIGDNALLKLGRLLARIDDRDLDPRSTPEAAPLLAALGYAIDGDLSAALARLRAEHPRVAAVVEPGLAVTLSPTMISGSEKVNVIPATAELRVDCRGPVEFGVDDVRARLEELIGDEGYALSWDRAVPGNRSPAEAPLMEHVRAAMAVLDPAAALAPRLFSGFSDSHWFRAAFPDCVAYGFFPQRAMTEPEAMPLMHADDERIPVEDVELATRFYADVVQRVLA